MSKHKSKKMCCECIHWEMGDTWGANPCRKPNTPVCISEGWRNDTECIDFDNFDEIPKDYWVFGFDTMHYDDGPHLDRDWCINETKDLLKQLQEL